MPDINFNKLFFIGYNKTATTSINCLLSQNKIKSKHIFGYDFVKDNPNIKCFSDIGDSYSIESKTNYPKLFKEYRNSLFILNTRSFNSWVESKITHKYWIKAVNSQKKYLHVEKLFTEPLFDYIINIINWRILEYKKIINFFEDKKDSLLLLNIDEENWQDFLCDFLCIKNFNLFRNKTTKHGNGYANSNFCNIDKIPAKEISIIKKNIKNAFKHLNIKDFTNPLLPLDCLDKHELDTLKSFNYNSKI